ncbi:ABC transporter ATP-binding protein [Haloferax sp. DFSO52]|uniref:ABC transporter ATP-binding protein n=1 Tax=Haloferax sp. DFSO52 TaxID=3388505 RepID=UPI003A8AD1A2
MVSDDTLVELADVRKEFGDVTAVKGIDLSIRRGEFFSLVGPSGCGKTTTLRMISGFETPTAGSVHIEERDMTGFPPEKRDTNLVFQHLSLFPHMSVAENVGYGLKKNGVGPEEREESVRTYLDLVDLDGYDDRSPAELSGGQQQRVALARALVNEPSVLLLDEPLSSLDRKLRKQMRVELRKIHEKTEGAFFYVTHDQEVAMTLSDRVAVMNEGEIEQVGTPEEIYRNPATPFVADFIGDTNLLSGRAQANGDSTHVTVGGALEFDTDEDVSGDVTVSVRPEGFSLATNGDGVEGTVRERYFQGDQTRYVLDMDAELPNLQIVMQGRKSPVETGETVAVTVDDDAPVVFDTTAS